MKCPSCGGKLELNKFNDLNLTSCCECGGHMLSEKDFRHVVEHRHDERRGRKKGKAGSLDCIVCSSAMDEVNYGGDSDVLIRKCHKCKSSWLSKGQAADIYDYLHSLKKFDRKVAEMQFTLEKKAEDLSRDLKLAEKKYRK
jgi:Zn-finger nucleic acid-binding protein